VLVMFLTALRKVCQARSIHEMVLLEFQRKMGSSVHIVDTAAETLLLHILEVLKMTNEGSRTLKRWMVDNEATPAVVASRIKVTRTAVLGWVSGRFKPNTVARAKVERLTHGKVGLKLWWSAREQKALKIVKPW